MSKLDKPTETGFAHSPPLWSALLVIGLGIVMIRTVLPLLHLLIPAAVGWWLWQRYRQIQQRQQEAIDTQFAQLLHTQHGRLTLFDFALATRLSAIAARRYLDTKASEFSAEFEVTEAGTVLYVFPTGAKSVTAGDRSPDSPTQPEVCEQSASANASANTTAHSPVNAALNAKADHAQRMTGAIAAATLPNSTPLNSTMPTPALHELTQSELAKRLGVSSSTLSRKKLAADFTEWSCGKDPAELGWRYVSETRRFCAQSYAQTRHPSQSSTESPS